MRPCALFALCALLCFSASPAHAQERAPTLTLAQFSPRLYAVPESAILPAYAGPSDELDGDLEPVPPFEPQGASPQEPAPVPVDVARGPRLVQAPVVHEDKPLKPGTWSDIHGARSFGWWAFGAVTAFFAHEGGHIFANLVQGNVPKIQGIWGLGFAPFFAIEPRIYCDPHGHCLKHNGQPFHDGVGGAAAITSAGFNVQHLTDEILLTRRPNLRTNQVAPYRKGMLAFNVLLSLGYAITSTAHIENAQGDVTSSTRLMGYPRAIYAAELVAIAGIDTYRYFVPNSRWAPWVSRAAKVGFFGMVFAF